MDREEFEREMQAILEELPPEEHENAISLMEMAREYKMSPRRWRELGLYL